MNLRERVAALEERTQPKPKRLLDHLKDWGGVGTLIVALLYTFPLGVWDRFYLTQQAREAAEVRALRDTALELARLDTEWATRAGAIPTPDLQTMATRALGSQKVTLLTGKLAALEAHHNRLTAPELVMLAFSLAQMNQPALTAQLYDTALVKAQAAGNTGLAADILRLQATTLLDREAPDLDQVRALYTEAVAQLSAVRTDAFVLQAAFTLHQWAQTELAKGDRACGSALLGLARDRVASLPAFLPGVAQYQRQFAMPIDRFPRPAGQPQEGCPEEILQRLTPKR